jgi:hypothetical protein
MEEQVSYSPGYLTEGTDRLLDLGFLNSRMNNYEKSIIKLNVTFVEWALVRTYMYNDHRQRDGRGVFDILITTIRSKFGCGRTPPFEVCDNIRAYVG